MESVYYRRLIDDDLDELLDELPAIAIEGAKGVGKSATALQRAKTVLRLDDVADRELLAAYPARLREADRPVLLDEWQRLPASWDMVRREVDRDPTGGRFLLTGSATPPPDTPLHSGAGRIDRLRLRPLSLAERKLGPEPTVRLRDLLSGERAEVSGTTDLELPDYVDEILASGFPGIRTLGERAREVRLDGYIDRIIDVEFPELGHRVRRPASLRAWLAAYAAATASTTSYDALLRAATPGHDDKPSKATTIAYRDTLERLWLLDPVTGWWPTRNSFGRLARSPKHHLADPALAARLLGVGRRHLLSNQTPAPHGDWPLLGALFESLVTLSIRVYAQRCRARVSHLRSGNGDHEIDLIVEGDDRRIVAIEVKLTPTATDDDVKQLRWIERVAGADVADRVVVTTGRHAYRRPDGVAVVPASLLTA